MTIPNTRRLNGTAFSVQGACMLLSNSHGDINNQLNTNREAMKWVL